MRKTIVPVTLAAALLLIGCPKKDSAQQGDATPQTDEQKTLYALGLNVGRNLAIFDIKPEELRYVQQGLADQLSGKKPAVELEQFGPKIGELARTRQNARLEVEKKGAAAFLETAAKEEGAQKAESGMIYKELQAGTGESPKATDTVRVHYKGTLTDGKEFDSSYKRGQPAEFPLNGVIPCWTEGLQKMKPGGKAKLVCPSNIAYGDSGRPPTIPGGATLVFEVELLEIKAAAATPTMTPNQPKPAQPAPKK